ncbi:MAG: toll/interleukin-1 receptor domain-containing protein [Alistipes sp.]|nr:toll/interleukin-1 receptor domain-containing protein [Alistipes sp.]
MAHPINSALRGRGYNTFYDADNLVFGDLNNQIVEAVKNSTIFLYLHTSNSVNSAWCRAELEYANKHDVNIIPIIFDGYIPDIPEDSSVSFLNRLNCFDFSTNLFDASITSLMSRWLNPILADTAKNVEITQNEIYVTSDRSCRVYRLEEIGVAYKDISTPIQIPEGNHKLMFVDMERESVRVEKSVEINGDTQEVDVKLLEKYKKSTNSDEIDVFISYNSDDLEYAKEIAEMCKYAGKSYFLSAENLKKMGESAYVEAIAEALDKSRHLVVVCMDVESLKSKWVKLEYTTFINEIYSGRKDGNMITIVNDGISVNDLPILLRGHEVIPYKQKENAVEYFK